MLHLHVSSCLLNYLDVLLVTVDLLHALRFDVYVFCINIIL